MPDLDEIVGLGSGPLGSGRARSGEGQVERLVRTRRRERRQARANRAMAVLLACLMVMTVAAGAFADDVKHGYWYTDDTTSDSQRVVTWYFLDYSVAAGGDLNNAYVQRSGGTGNKVMAVTATAAKGSPYELYGSTPSGYKPTYATSKEQASPSQRGKYEAASADDAKRTWQQDTGQSVADDAAEEQARHDQNEEKWSDDLVISQDTPEFDIGHVFPFLSHSITKVFYNIAHGACEGMADLAGGMMSLLNIGSGSSQGKLFTADFDNGTWSSFYSLIKKINDNVAVPFGTAFLGVALGLTLVQMTDRYRHSASFEWYEGGVLNMVLLLAISFTLINHAMDICGTIYQLGNAFATQVADYAGVANSLGDSYRDGMTAALVTPLESLTYAQAGIIFLIMIFGLACVCVVGGCVIHVVGVAVLRMAEIYLRSAVSPIPFSFFLDEKTRPMGWNWVKRFAAVCFQAGLIMLALAICPLLFDVAGQLFQASSGDSPIIAAFKACIPPLVCVTSVNAVVGKTEQVANGLFGLGV